MLSSPRQISIDTISLSVADVQLAFDLYYEFTKSFMLAKKSFVCWRSSQSDSSIVEMLKLLSRNERKRGKEHVGQLLTFQNDFSEHFSLSAFDDVVIAGTKNIE